MSRGTVLVLEDSRVQAQLISKMLTGLNWSAMLSFDHKTVFSLLKNSRFDLLLLDVYIEGGNTLMHLPEIRELAPDVPIAIMTAGGAGGGALHSTLNMARRAQADFVVPKPFAPEDLNIILQEAFKMRRAPVLPKHVLVVDDCRVVRKLSTVALAEKGYRISEARSMEEAFDRVDIAHVDIVLTDIFMPGMGGIEGIGIIKSTWPEVAIVAMSAGSDHKLDPNQALAAARYMGADALLPKPFTASDLTYLMEAVLVEKTLAA
ncbi:response regulator [Asticcacaulis sp. EMRT-3]|uniref:response regulator n=1 Tax=Asticcacaulis sp. EMRT-3 TaxID=3040349 RepID=UPI0024AFCCD6|nr:response regulator [Asticcacaulis sp. EMRT-3]MDI7774623.1 response regulator [Asticcacaulis sp. EMRT-3]